jgi:hypothetical protein
MNISFYRKNNNNLEELTFTEPWFEPTDISPHKDGVAFKGRMEDFIDWLLDCQQTQEELIYVITEHK